MAEKPAESWMGYVIPMYVESYTLQERRKQFYCVETIANQQLTECQ